VSIHGKRVEVLFAFPEMRGWKYVVNVTADIY